MNYCQVVVPKEIKIIMKSSLLFSSLNKYSYYTETSNKHMLLQINISNMYNNMYNNMSTWWYSNISVSWQWWIFSYQNYAYNPSPWCTCPQPAYEAFLIRNYIKRNILLSDWSSKVTKLDYSKSIKSDQTGSYQNRSKVTKLKHIQNP